MKEGKPDDLFKAWLALSTEQCNKMDADFRDIYEMCCEKGFHAIIDESEWQMQDAPDDRATFIAKLSALSNHDERAMITFLDHNAFWIPSLVPFMFDGMTKKMVFQRSLCAFRGAPLAVAF